MPECTPERTAQYAAVEALLLRLAAGDGSALEALYAQTHVGVYAFALSITRSVQDAEDVVQESFVKFFSNIASFDFRGEGSLKAWLLRIVVNEAISMTRKQSRLTFVDEVPEEVPDEDPEVERVPPAELTRMIGELPEGYRLVLNMFVFEQRSHKEIAEQLGIKESSSASQYLRAKKLLAKKINDYLNTLNEKEYE